MWNFPKHWVKFSYKLREICFNWVKFFEKLHEIFLKISWNSLKIYIKFSSQRREILLKIHRLLQEDRVKNWEMFWENLSSTNKLQTIKPTPSLWKPGSPCSRELEVTLCCLQFSHSLHTQAYILNHQPQPQCQFYNQLLIVEYILSECSHLTPQRQSVNLPKDYKPFSRRKILRHYNATSSASTSSLNFA